MAVENARIKNAGRYSKLIKNRFNQFYFASSMKFLIYGYNLKSIMRFLYISRQWPAIFLIIFFLSLLSYSCSYSAKTTRQLLEASKSTVYDVVVVPGAPLENGKWSRTVKGRVYWAKYLYDQKITKNILFSGSAVYTPYYEGIIMAQYAIALGIPAEHVFYETKAEHSTENIYYSFIKAKELGFHKIALASDPFQTKLLRRFAHKRLSRDIAMLPMVKDTMKMLEPSMTDPVIDISKAYANNFISLKKREGFFKRLKGTLGYNIK